MADQTLTTPVPHPTEPDTFTLDLDFAHESSSHAGRDREVSEYAASYGVRAEVIDPSGPGGGWPVVRFTGTDRALRILAADYDGEATDPESETN